MLPLRTLLRLLLATSGAFFIVGLYPASRLWPEGFGWNPPHPEFERMITAIYASLGVFLIRASRHPERHRSLIDFAMVSSFAHGAVMGVDAGRGSANRLHLFTDIPALLLFGVALLALRGGLHAPKEDLPDGATR